MQLGHTCTFYFCLEHLRLSVGRPPSRVEPPHDREDVRALVMVVGATESSGQARLSPSRLVIKIEGLRHQPLRGAGGEGFEAGNSLGGKAEGKPVC